MKKLTFKILAGLLIIATSFVLNSCSKKVSTNADTFSKTLQGMGFEVVDITDQYAQYNHIKKVLGCEKNGHHIEFFEVADEEHARGMLETNQEGIESSAGSSSSKSFVNAANYSKFTMNSDKYYVVSQIDATMIYAYSEKGKDKELDGIIEKLGY